MITPERIRNDFPNLAGKVYLNTAAEGIPPAAVDTAVSSYLKDKQLGMDGREAHFRMVDDCREIAARLLGRASPDIDFCSCSAEAYNLLATTLDFEANDEVVLSDLDFPSGATPWLVQKPQPKVRLWQSSKGRLELTDLRQILTPKTRLVQLSLVSFYNGFRLQWPELVTCIRTHAPQAIIAVDVTQALGRCVLDGLEADIIISSTHKWTLGLHGGCIVAVRPDASLRLTTRAGGWYNLVNPFAEDRFSRVESKRGAASYAVGMPSFAPIYALNAGLRYLDSIGIDNIAHYADQLIRQAYDGLLALDITPLAPAQTDCSSGIIAFKHPAAESLHRSLYAAGVHVMYSAGRLRLSIHGYNTSDDVDRFLHCLKSAMHFRPPQPY